MDERLLSSPRFGASRDGANGIASKWGLEESRKSWTSTPLSANCMFGQIWRILGETGPHRSNSSQKG